ncbi:MAG: hypothetical protein LBK27_04520 [Treponema sp.]|jgi:hypothetical protein|nr:hypothetical protein [Treponema sp.]
MKKIIGLLVMACVLSTAVFAQEEGPKHRHEPLDMLLGINLGTTLFATMKDFVTNPKVSFLWSADFGLTYDFYVFSWLSVNTGLLLHPQFSAIWKPEYEEKPDLKLTDYIQAPLCLTVPLQAHVNVPRVEWLYLGAGINLNFPVTGMLEELEKAIGLDMPDSKGKFFVSVPVDFGFDMTDSRNGGVRLFFRLTPTFLEQGTLVPFGVMWQIYNFRIGS